MVLQQPGGFLYFFFSVPSLLAVAPYPRCSEQSCNCVLPLSPVVCAHCLCPHSPAQVGGVKKGLGFDSTPPVELAPDKRYIQTDLKIKVISLLVLGTGLVGCSFWCR
jgi:hypothetical protein